MDEVQLAHQLLVLFCNSFQTLLGRENCTPNMHMHLASCIKEYGPIYAFWCYSFERYNGILGNYHTNNHSISITLARKFLARLCTHTNLQKLGVDGLPPLSSFGLHSVSDKIDVTILDEIRRQDNIDIKLISKTYCICTIPKLYCLSKQEIKDVTSLLLTHGYTLSLQKYVHIYSKIQLGRMLIKVKSFRGGENKDHVVLCRHTNGGEPRPGVIENIFVIPSTVTSDNNDLDGIDLPLVQVKLFKEHPKRYFFGKNCVMQLWSTSFESSQFFLLTSILRKCSFVKAIQNFERIELANGKRSRFRANDEVYFIT